MNGHLLMVDHRDSYTHILLDYFRQLEWQTSCVQSEDLHLEYVNNFDFLVLSPGFGRPEDKRHTLTLIREYAGKPTIGICLGHQLLALAHGGSVRRAHRPLHGIMTQMIWEQGHDLNGFSGKQKIMHYHSWVVNDMPKGARALGYCDQTDAIMGMNHRALNFIGWQFHPESVGTEKGLELLQASIRYVLD